MVPQSIEAVVTTMLYRTPHFRLRMMHSVLAVVQISRELSLPMAIAMLQWMRPRLLSTGVHSPPLQSSLLCWQSRKPHGRGYRLDLLAEDAAALRVHSSNLERIQLGTAQPADQVIRLRCCVVGGRPAFR
ncbi:hypothetical protein XENOCAPTIV_000727 [Xenoophorus captivus]|uniref:Uncharacterized protein n=1 Tax=Xenoophorus captivus TaxID=1517983 RepID=A0ABV0RVR8_9TELE